MSTAILPSTFLSKISSKIKNLANYRLWHFKGEPEDIRGAVQKATHVRKKQESEILREYIDSLEPVTKRYALARMQDAQKNTEILHNVLSAKVGCARELLDNGMLVASSVMMSQVTAWYRDCNRPLPRIIIEMAELTIRAQAANADI